MVYNFFVKCEVCNCCIRIRYQVSEENCLIDFHCPSCQTHINGSIKTIYHYDKVAIERTPWHYNLNLNNASETQDYKEEYILEVSPDFLVNKLVKNENAALPTPFLRHMELTKNNSTASRFNNFLQIWKEKWNLIKVNIDLCHNKQYELLVSRLPHSYEMLPKDINAIMTTHQDLITFCNKILPKNILHEYSKMNKRILKLVHENNNEMDLFFNYYNLESIKDCERKIIQLIEFFLDSYPKFIPIFNSLSYKDNNNLRLSTLTFEDIKSFYQDSYELILFLLPQIIGLNNIAERKELNKFSIGEFDFKEKIDSYSSKYKIYEELFNVNDKFSWLVNNEVKNHIRNSIGHFNYKVIEPSQEIVFIHNHKGKERKTELSLIDVAKNCIYMFYTLINLLELNYSLLKILIISQDNLTKQK